MDTPGIQPVKAGQQPLIKVNIKTEQDAISKAVQDILPQASGNFASRASKIFSEATGSLTLSGRIISDESDKPTFKGELSKVAVSVYSQLIRWRMTTRQTLLNSLLKEIAKNMRIETKENFKYVDFSRISSKKLDWFSNEVKKMAWKKEKRETLINQGRAYQDYHVFLKNVYGKENKNSITAFQSAYAFWSDYFAGRPLRQEDELEKGFPKSTPINQERKPSKTVEFKKGSTTLTTGTRVDFCSSPGFEDTQEDRFEYKAIRLDPNQTVDLVGVFDGHGGGKWVDFVSKALPLHLEKQLQKVDIRDEKEVQKAIERAFENTGNNPIGTESGTTATVSIRIGNRLFTAHLGDSQAQLLRKNGQVLQLTRDQKPNDPELMKRGVVIIDDKIFGKLEAGGGFGDLNVPGISRRPEISVATLQEGEVCFACAAAALTSLKKKKSGRTSPFRELRQLYRPKGAMPPTFKFFFL